MKHFFPFLLIIVFHSCSNHNSNNNLPDLSNVNKVRLCFKSDFDSANKIILKRAEIDSEEDIELIKNTITDGNFPYVYCISTGSMEFFIDTSLIATMVFNTTPDFRHIAYNFDNKLIAIPLSEANAGLLESFKNIAH